MSFSSTSVACVQAARELTRAEVSARLELAWDQVGDSLVPGGPRPPARHLVPIPTDPLDQPPCTPVDSHYISPVIKSHPAQP